MKRDSQELLVRERFVAGSLAGAISQSAIYPMEVGPLLNCNFCSQNL